jgi:hypothetical protein
MLIHQYWFVKALFYRYGDLTRKTISSSSDKADFYQILSSSDEKRSDSAERRPKVKNSFLSKP